MQIPSVQALRGLAALAVVLFHFRIYLSDENLLRQCFAFGTYGVQVFFVLSGFVLCHSLYHREYQWRGYGLFLWRRVLRLEPPYLLSIALVIGLRWLTFMFSPFSSQTHFSVSGWNILAHVGYLIPWTGGQWVNAVYWTLAIEFQFYLLIGLLFPLLLHGERFLRNLFILLWLCLSLLPFSDIYVTHYAALFGVGMLWFMEREWVANQLFIRVLLFLCFPLLWWQFDIGTAIAAALAFFIGHFWRRGVPVFLQRLGDWSYSLYLLHIPLGATFLLQFACKFLHGDAWATAMIFVVTAVCIGFSALFYRWVEQPFKRWAAKQE